ncbi:alpha/beta hydrolase-fold protein [uncultured Bifidobacterium sp.]|uniref:alpha/beta hydrolase n=1 Tax=uncultured Bifidobacterium sp. TaxID=165187 RepID=UPI0026395616|nr:alpha/beta hydrolase-fold protein [uncultured Bifidobacterium sp.]
MSQRSDSLPGRVSSVVPGVFGERLEVRHELWSRGHGSSAPGRPLIVCLHGWGSNEADIADIMRYIAPFNDYVSLRAPLVLEEGGSSSSGLPIGAYSWFHDCVPTGEDLDRDAYAAAVAIDRWVKGNIPADRDVVPLGFSQGGLLAVHLLRVNAARYRAAISLSGFLAPGVVDGSAPEDDELPERETPVFFGYGLADTVIPRYEIQAMSAWLDEHTWLTSHGYPRLDHSVSLEEFADIRQWLMLNDISSGVI